MAWERGTATAGGDVLVALLLDAPLVEAHLRRLLLDPTVTHIRSAEAKLYLRVTWRQFRAYVHGGLITRTGRAASTRYSVRDVLALGSALAASVPGSHLAHQPSRMLWYRPAGVTATQLRAAGSTLKSRTSARLPGVSGSRSRLRMAP